MPTRQLTVLQINDLHGYVEEFANGPEHFKALATQLHYPVLALNCYDKHSEKLVFHRARH